MNKYESLAGKSVFVTGGASGIGAAFVKAFARQGAQVAFVDIADTQGRALAEELVAAACPEPLFICCDVTEPKSLCAAIDQASDKHGDISVLINNVANDTRENLEDLTVEQWQKSLQINLNPAFFASQAVVPGMRAAGAGVILNISSINALFGPADMPSYITAKAGLLGLTKSMARDLGSSGIRVNCILPGWIITEKQLSHWLTPDIEAQWMDQVCLKERIYPDDVANLALFLASDDARMITSQQFVIDGGRL